jgi:sulfite exporter TauE/SafE
MELWTAFLLGLAGSVHCAGMCGPLVLALAKVRPRTKHEWAGRLFHHLGRLLSYCLLGLALGSLSHAIVPPGFQRWLSALLGTTLLTGLLLSARAPIAGPFFRWVALLKNSTRFLLQKNTLASHVLMGALNGLLPCGLVYIAAAGAASTGHSWSGAAYMALFGAGTWPMMLGIHFAGQRLPLPSRFPLGGITRGAVLVMAVLLILRGLELGIPFVSPNISAVISEGGSCH